MAAFHFSYLQVAINGANLQNVFMLLTLEPLLARSPFLVLHVRRSNLVGDALRELSIHSDIDLKKPLKVSFLPIFSTLLFSKHFCRLSAIYITASPVCSNFSIAVTHRNTLVSARIESFFWLLVCFGCGAFRRRQAQGLFSSLGVLRREGSILWCYAVAVLPFCRSRLFTIGCVLSLRDCHSL